MHPRIDVIEPREADVGGVPVRRALPRARRRTVGAWCFVDLAGPIDVEQAAMQVGPHPHIGLHTVSWMLEGEVVHRDSLGSEQVLRPGELNLMTAGRGIAHAEQVPTGARGVQHLVQLWVAQPEVTRHGPPDFAHHDELPIVGLGSNVAKVLIGAFGGVTSPVRADTPLLGVDLGRIDTELDVPLDAPPETGFEHAVLAVDGPLVLAERRGEPGTVVPAGALAYIAPGVEQIVVSGSGARAMLLGGEPLGERLAMHWNFVARHREELAEAVDDWNASIRDGGNERFGRVGGGLDPVPSPPVAGQG
jgi:quercetin 2,3-dioxygenase